MSNIQVTRVPDGQHGWHAHDPRRLTHAADVIRTLPVVLGDAQPTDASTVVIPCHQLTFLVSCFVMFTFVLIF